MDQNNKFCYFDGSKFVILMDQNLIGGINRYATLLGESALNPPSELYTNRATKSKPREHAVYSGSHYSGTEVEVRLGPESTQSIRAQQSKSQFPATCGIPFVFP